MADHAAAIQIRLLGVFEITVHGQSVASTGWRLRKAEELVRILALAPGHRLHRDQLIDLLWPDKDPAAGANNLYQAVHAARAALGRGQPTITIQDAIVHLGHPADGDVWVDVDAFEGLARRAGGEIEALEAARGMYRGELLPDDPYAEWAITRREALRALQLRVLGELALAYERAGRLAEALEALREALVVDPLDEDLQRRLIRLEGQTGNRAAAVRQFETLRASLRTELDLEPAGATVEAYREALGARTAATPAAPISLPTPVTSFIGRTRERADVQGALRTSRLVTLTGTGGTGKTRLAIEAARTMADAFPDGIWFVGLASVTTGRLVPRAVADVLGVREPTGSSLLERICSLLTGRTALLVLDNCEHVVDAAAGFVSAVLQAAPATTVLATSRQPLRVAGEVQLRVPSLAVGDPTAPAAPNGELPDGVVLFVERAQATKPGFALTDANTADVLRLCYHLDGLPLALELAASRIGSLPIGALVDRLDQRFALLVGGNRTALTRHETLEATLDWSYNLLDEEARRVLRAISVFAAGVSPNAAESVCGDGEKGRRPVLGVVAELVDQSLVSLDESGPDPRYRLLETVRQYGRDKLARSGETAMVEGRLFDWALTVARGEEADASDRHWAGRLGRVEREHDNLRAALERALHTQPQTALALAAALWPYWLWSGHLAEGRGWLTRALALDPAGRDPQLRAHALLGLGALTGRSGDPRRHAQLSAEAASILRDLGDASGEARALQFRGIAHWAADELGLAEEAFERSRSLAESAGSVGGVAAALACLGVVRDYVNDAAAGERYLAEAAALLGDAAGTDLVPPIIDLGEAVIADPAHGVRRLIFEQTFAPFRDMPPREALGHVLLSRGRLARQSGDDERARGHSKVALDLFRTDGDERGVADALAAIAALDAEAGDVDDAIAGLNQSLAIRRGLGDFRGAALAASNLGRLEGIAGRTEEAGHTLTAALGAFRRHGDAWGTAATLGNLASLAVSDGRPGDARVLLEESLLACRATGRKRWVGWALIQLAALGMADRSSIQAANEALEIFDAIGERPGQSEARALLDRAKPRYVAAKVGRGTSRRSLARRAARRPN